MDLTVGQSRLRRTLKIQRLVQLFLLGLLALTALHFQQLLHSQGRPQAFLAIAVGSLLLQLVLFLPIRRFARAEADRDLLNCSGAFTDAMKASQRQQRLFSDLLKTSLFLFLLVFILLAPAATVVLATVFFTFVLGLLTYLQCYARFVRQWLPA